MGDTFDKIKKGLNDDVKREISFICDPEHTLCKGKIELVKFQTFFQTRVPARVRHEPPGPNRYHHCTLGSVA